jgi:hypothetical protein
MLIGHFGVGLGLKRFAPEVNLGFITAAATLPDFLWGSFLLLGWERSRIVPGITKFSPYEMSYVPWSHGLAACVLWSVLVATATLLLKRTMREALCLALAVVSHWILDFITHRPDLPILGERKLFGLSLYNSTIATMLLETSLLIFGMWLYVRSTSARNRHGRVGIFLYLAALLYVFVAGHFTRPPDNIRLAAISALVMLSFFSLFGAWVDSLRKSSPYTRHRQQEL